MWGGENKCRGGLQTAGLMDSLVYQRQYTKMFEGNTMLGFRGDVKFQEE